MNKKRYTIAPDAPSKGYRIFDNATEKFVLEDGRTITKIYPRLVQAEAEAQELNEMDALEADAADPTTVSEDATTSHSSVTKATAPPKYGDWANRDEYKNAMRQEVVLGALAGKVVCSACGKAYHGDSGSLAVGPAAAPTHSIKVTRYIGFDTPNLTVDIDCMDCGHGGLYEFAGNPLIDAGIVKEDIPF